MSTPWVDEMLDEKAGLAIAPLIDCVFLLLIYFMVTSSLKKSEADLGITLPGSVTQSQEQIMPDEQIIEVDAQGRVMLNGRDYGENGSKEMPELYETLVRYRLACRDAKSKALITIYAADEAMHERTIDVMNLCAGAGIKHVSFSAGGD